MSSRLVEVGKDLTAGTMAGIAQLLVGHPFDTVKVKLQSQQMEGTCNNTAKYSGAWDAVKKIMASEGPKGLYRGLSAPLAAVALFNAVLFTARGQMEAILSHNKEHPSLSVRQQMVAGVGAGVAVSFVACPTELIKCRLQAQSSSTTASPPPPPPLRYKHPKTPNSTFFINIFIQYSSFNKIQHCSLASGPWLQSAFWITVSMMFQNV